MKKARDLIIDMATITVAVAAVVLAVRAFLPTSAVFPEIAQPDREVFDLWPELLSGGHALGPADAALTIVEFGDYECPACRGSHRVFTEFLARHPGEVRFVYRHWPLDVHPFAHSAARAAECAGEQGAFWGFHNSLYEDRDWVGDAFERFAAKSGVEDLERFRRCAADRSRTPVIERDIVLARAVGGLGTPTVVANGVLLGRLPTPERLEALLEDARRGRLAPP